MGVSSSKPIIGLLSDFGSSDGYVASMKASILHRCPEANLIDIGHNVEPGDVRRASFILSTCARDFPPASYFLAVVDPGVGTSRAGLVISLATHTFVLPDNGLISHTLQCFRDHAPEIRRIITLPSMPSNPSPTFHGRDIFAPVVGLLASRRHTLSEMGAPIASLVTLPLPRFQIQNNGVEGEVVFVDRFGNLITNIPESLPRCPELSEWSQVSILGRSLPLVRTFGELAPQMGLAYWGSSGFLELAINQGNAFLSWKAGQGTRVFLTGTPSPPLELSSK